MYLLQDGSTLPMAQRAYHPEEFLRSETLKLGILFIKPKCTKLNRSRHAFDLFVRIFHFGKPRQFDCILKFRAHINEILGQTHNCMHGTNGKEWNFGVNETPF